MNSRCCQKLIWQLWEKHDNDNPQEIYKKLFDQFP